MEEVQGEDAENWAMGENIMTGLRGLVPKSFFQILPERTGRESISGTNSELGNIGPPPPVASGTPSPADGGGENVSVGGSSTQGGLPTAAPSPVAAAEPAAAAAAAATPVPVSKSLDDAVSYRDANTGMGGYDALVKAYVEAFTAVAPDVPHLFMLVTDPMSQDWLRAETWTATTFRMCFLCERRPWHFATATGASDKDEILAEGFALRQPIEFVLSFAPLLIIWLNILVAGQTSSDPGDASSPEAMEEVAEKSQSALEHQLVLIGHRRSIFRHSRRAITSLIREAAQAHPGVPPLERALALAELDPSAMSADVVRSALKPGLCRAFAEFVRSLDATATSLSSWSGMIQDDDAAAAFICLDHCSPTTKLSKKATSLLIDGTSRSPSPPIEPTKGLDQVLHEVFGLMTGWTGAGPDGGSSVDAGTRASLNSAPAGSSDPPGSGSGTSPPPSSSGRRRSSSLTVSAARQRLASPRAVSVNVAAVAQKSGTMYKLGGFRKGTWQPRYCVLHHDHFVYYKRQGEQEPQGCIHLAGSIVELNESGLGGKNPDTCITMVDNLTKARYFVRGGNDAETLNWYTTLSAACDLERTNMACPFRSLRRGSISRLFDSVKQKRLSSAKVSSDYAADTSPVIVEGILHKRGGRSGKKWQPRFFVLKANTLYYFSGAQDVEPRGTIELSTIASVTIPDGAQDRDFCFLLTSGARTGDRAKDVFLSAASQPELATWVDALSTTVTELTASRISPGAPPPSSSSPTP